VAGCNSVSSDDKGRFNRRGALQFGSAWTESGAVAELAYDPVKYARETEIHDLININYVRQPHVQKVEKNFPLK
jgi:hypothetical protein